MTSESCLGRSSEETSVCSQIRHQIHDISHLFRLRSLEERTHPTDTKTRSLAQGATSS